MNITFIGGGNMATALVAGLLKARPGQISIRVADPSGEARERIMREYNVETFEDGASATPGADVVVLAVKPQVMPSVLGTLAPVIENGQLILSIAAGTTVSGIQAALGAQVPVVRAMPNTPALIGHGISGLFASPTCRDHHREQAERILKASGEVVWLSDEALMDVVTAVSGSGPAYFFLLTEALAAAGASLGLPEGDARRLAVRTAEGAGAMLSESGETPEMVRKRVTSPGGTTQAALEVLESNKFREMMRGAVEAATRRGQELAG
jgi:pyrroline-5-carboxylate reductase